MASMRRPRSYVMRTALIALAAAGLLASQAGAQQSRHDFRIPSQDAAKALQLFAAQAGRQLLFSYDAAAGHQAPAIEGLLDDHVALMRIAEAAGLAITSDDGITITLGRTVEPTKSAAKSTPDPAPARTPSRATSDASPTLVPLENIVVTS